MTAALGDEIAELSVSSRTPPPPACSTSSASSTPAAGTRLPLLRRRGSSWRVGLDLGAARSGPRSARPRRRCPGLARRSRAASCPTPRSARSPVATPETEERAAARRPRRHRRARRADRPRLATRRPLRSEIREAPSTSTALRALHVHPDEDGTVAVRGRLAPEVGALLRPGPRTAAREALFQRPASRGAGVTFPRTFPDGNANVRAAASRRPGAPRRAALHHGLDPALPASATKWSFTSMPRSWPTRSRRASPCLDDWRRVSAERPSAWPATPAAVVMQPRARWPRGSSSAPRRALFHPRLRARCLIATAAAASRAAACAFGQGHHIRHWAHGGPTTLSNLAMLCRRHHRAVHEEGYQVERRGRTASSRSVIPSARVIPDVTASPTSPSIPCGRSERGTTGDWACATHGPRCRSGSDERLDVGYAIDVLATACARS